MAAGYNTGVQNRICRQPHPGKTTQSGDVFSHRASSVAGGSRENALQTGNCRDPCRDSGSTVLFEPLFSPQEGRRHETSNQLEGVEHLCSTPSLQDGGPTHTERPPEDRRLDDQGRSEGRILHDPDTQLRQISPLLPSPKSSLPIHMPTIRPVLCSLGLYQDPEASIEPTQRAGCQVSGINRRCIGLSRDGREGEGPHEWSDLSTGEFGVPSPPRENSARANSGDRIPGNDSRFKDERTAPTWPEIEEDKAGGCKNQRSTSHTLYLGGVTPTREIQLSFPALQQSSTEGPSRSPGDGRPMLRNPVPPLPYSKGGASVVGQPVVSVEWKESGAETARPSNRIRRIPHQLGSSMPGDADRGTMVPAGEVPHINCLELLAATLAVKTFLKGQAGKRVLLLPNNQTAVTYINNLGGTVSAQATTMARELWMWCLQRDILLTAQHLPGVENVRADTESRVMRDRSDSMLNPRVFQRIQAHFPHLDVDLFATRLTYQPVLQLEARPSGGGDRCLSPRLEAGERIRKPSMEPRGESVIEGGSSGGGINTNSPSLALTTMVWWDNH